MNDHPLRRQVQILMSSLLPEAIIEAMLIPMNPFIVGHLLPDSPNQGYYTGLFSSAFYSPLFIMNILWGGISDRFGRKPVLVLGLIVGAFSSLTLVYSTTYTLSFLARFICGVFGSNSTVAKGMIGDLLHGEEQVAWGYSTYGSVYGFSGILGPLLTSLLYDPSKLYPFWFETDGFFGKRPYALPCLVGFLLTLAGLYTTYFHLKDKNELKKILKKNSGLYHKVSKGEEDELNIEMIPSSSSERNQSLLDKDSNRNLESLQSSSGSSLRLSYLSFDLFGPIFLYCVIAFCSMIYMTAVPIYISAHVHQKGLGLTPQQTSLCTMIISMVKFPLQVYGLHKFLVYFQTLKQCYKVGLMLLIPVHILLPILSFYSMGFLSWTVLLICMILIGVAEVLCFLSAIVMITETTVALYGPANLGMIHGFASTMSAFVRTLAPPIAGILWEMGQGPFVFGSNGFFILVFGIVGSMSLKIVSPNASMNEIQERHENE